MLESADACLLASPKTLRTGYSKKIVDQCQQGTLPLRLVTAPDNIKAAGSDRCYDEEFDLIDLNSNCLIKDYNMLKV